MQRLTNVITIKALSFSYKKEQVLEDISLAVEKNDFVVIIGPNGGGKSTLLKVILGIYELQTGTIEIFNQPYQSQIQKIGYVPQNTNINLSFPITVLEVVMMGQHDTYKRLFGYKQEEKRRAFEVLKEVNMEGYAETKISDLSGGQRQRVLIARALFSRPEILLLDEPTSNIDVAGSEQVFRTLEKLNETITILLVSHDLSHTLRYASRALYINKHVVEHDLRDKKKQFGSMDQHLCEVELLEVLGESK